MPDLSQHNSILGHLPHPLDCEPSQRLDTLHNTLDTEDLETVGKKFQDSQVGSGAFDATSKIDIRYIDIIVTLTVNMSAQILKCDESETPTVPQ